MLVLTNALALMQYLAAVASDGDYLNDFLTHAPAIFRADFIRLAHLIFSR